MSGNEVKSKSKATEAPEPKEDFLSGPAYRVDALEREAERPKQEPDEEGDNVVQLDTGNKAEAEEAPSKPKPKAKPASKPAKKPSAEKPKPKRIGRKKTGRNIKFNHSVTLETSDGFYDLYEKLNQTEPGGVTMGEVVERAWRALKREVEAKG